MNDQARRDAMDRIETMMRGYRFTFAEGRELFRIVMSRSTLPTPPKPRKPRKPLPPARPMVWYHHPDTNEVVKGYLQEKDAQGEVSVITNKPRGKNGSRLLVIGTWASERQAVEALIIQMEKAVQTPLEKIKRLKADLK